jgi:hypothetical protein
MSNSIDLTQRPPRSPRVRLGGFVILPRTLDKGRADLAGKIGEYHFNCPLDQRFLEFVQIDAEALKEQLAAGKGDGEILKWIMENSKTKPSPVAIEAWASFVERRVPADLETRKFFDEMQAACGPERDDIATWFDLLDLDDHVTFGGKA